MADKKKDPRVSVMLPQGVAADSYIDKPDDTAPAGASFTPDGKYKVSIVYDDGAPLAAALLTIRKAATAKWGEVDFEEFHFPFKEYDADARREGFRGKVVATAKTRFKLEGAKKVDAKRQPLPDSVKIYGGDIVKAIASLYLYEKVEAVRVGKKTENVKVRGCSLQLDAIQLIAKRAMGGSSISFGDEDGFEVSEADAAAPAGAGDDDF